MQAIRVARLERPIDGFGCSEPECNEPPRFRFIAGTEAVFLCSKHVFEFTKEFGKALAGKAKEF